ncbi:hypothetical protein K490DRAFT_59556 [Saccharata proteae CBS 121410]|uniref:Uncharacterized protein n=1 Tax=Saccharata proteae CBS 121410 TaxID=1314787 RepID=A0A9P4HSP7_9PEZI|nr:hypothetical protein K490DRAFT_59556 [Saccharata proteae CBS 121410]
MTTPVQDCCMGHCRAQRFAMDSRVQAAFEAEKAAITSYEENWDSWDGPVWPYRTTAKAALNEDDYQGCCTPPAEIVDTKPATTITTTSENTEKTTLQVPRPQVTRAGSSLSITSTTSNTSTGSLWHCGMSAPCPSERARYYEYEYELNDSEETYAFK